MAKNQILGIGGPAGMAIGWMLYSVDYMYVVVQSARIISRFLWALNTLVFTVPELRSRYLTS